MFIESSPLKSSMGLTLTWIRDVESGPKIGLMGMNYFRAQYQRKSRNCTWRNKLRSSKSQVSFVLNFPNPLGNETHMPSFLLVLCKACLLACIWRASNTLENPTYTRTYSLLCILLKSWTDLIPTSTRRYKTHPLPMPLWYVYMSRFTITLCCLIFYNG